ncbi:type IV pilus biogenesis/stability protein PilW [Aquisalimonas asiatica]|uniref:Type IV pilus assembly protein PilF n=1 Tax=Aquisalimonas asiatica TaxID=406100 RepID=A0A1H8PMZ7_9GAMM|nr:type IV pilus biogenesis/stability protein PilW [Aquisalimonas asiatica]SEO43078.1 type IV pilus assembly protein PilF [Aquisalimonas asiatica]
MMRLLRASLVLVVLVAVGCASGQQGREASRINTQLGVNYMQQGNLSQANESLDKALEQDRRNPEAHAAKAVLAERLGEYDDADHHYRRSLRLDDDQSSVRNNYGRFLCSQGRYDDAEEQFQYAIDDSLYQRRHVALANAGLCAMRDGREEEAEEYLRRALQHESRFAPALRHLAELRYDNGDYLSARGYYQRLMEQQSQNAATLWLGVRIENALDNKDEAASYALRLRSDYPDSEEAQALRRMDRDD